MSNPLIVGNVKMPHHLAPDQVGLRLYRGYSNIQDEAELFKRRGTDDTRSLRTSPHPLVGRIVCEINKKNDYGEKQTTFKVGTGSIIKMRYEGQSYLSMLTAAHVIFDRKAGELLSNPWFYMA